MGKGDIDLLTSNVYMTWGAGNPEPRKDSVDALVGAFGTDGTYITEFSPNSSGLDYYSEDESVQAVGVSEIIEYIKASGIERALFFCCEHYAFGAIKDDGAYRLLWSQALLNAESVKFATVPTKTTIISLPDAIALIPRITK